MKAIAIRWIILLMFLLMSPVYMQAQEEAEEATEEQDALNLIFRTIPEADFNGSSYTISGEAIRNLPVTNLTNVLAGLIPGVFTRQSQGGMVNESSSYWIRGIRTYSEGVLVLIDGQEREFGVLSPHEVESITVLKDAAATVLYGMRAANGAILVNTRKGRVGRPTVEFTTQMISQEPINLLEPLGALDYAEYYNQALKNDGMDETSMYSQYYLSHYRDRTGVNTEFYPDINWLDAYFKSSTWLQRHNMNITGGTERTRYFVNAGYTGQLGMFVTGDEFTYSTNNDVGRYNLRSNVEFDVTATTLLSVDLYGWQESQNRPGGSSINAYTYLFETPPNAFPEFYADHGSYVDQSGNAITSVNDKIIAGNGINTNPWAFLNRGGYATINQTYGSFRTQLTQDMTFVTPGLKGSVILSMDSYAQAVANRTKDFAFYQAVDPDNPDVLRRTGTDSKMSNSVGGQNSHRRNTLDVRLTYSRQFDLHGVTALAFYNQYEFSNEVSIPSRFQGGGSWIGYNYDKRYGVDVLMSYQGAYKFAPERRFGFFPTIAAGWTISNEAFFAHIKEYVPYLKLKASHGVVGSHRGVSDFRYMGRLNATTQVYNFGNTMGNVHGYLEDIIANPFLTWEKAEQTNVGIESRLLGNRLWLSAEYFHDKRYDIYVTNNRVTSMLGTAVTVEENIGEMYTDGFDLGARWSSRVGDFGYSLGSTLSISQNMVTTLGEVDQPYPYMQGVGYPRGVKRGYVFDGFFSSYEEIAAAPAHTFSEVHPGDMRYKDINGDGIVDVNDRVPLGYGDTPDIFYGINLSVSYKGFGMTALLQGASRVSRTMDGRTAYPFLSNGNIYTHQLDYWRPEYQDATLPAISRTHSGGVNNTVTSSFWIRDANYLRLNTLEVYYDLPQALLRQVFVSNLRLFVSAFNAHTWTSYDSPLDPEDDPAASNMPLTRNISFGLSLKF
jgi:TonB-linked SusC/RagA family outer membrane protein